MIEDRLEAAAVRCLSIMRRYHNSERTAASRALMAEEIGAVVARLIELDPPPGTTLDRVLTPVEDYLLARHGHEAGRRLVDEFVRAFEASGMDLICRRSLLDRGPRPRPEAGFPTI